MIFERPIHSSDSIKGLGEINQCDVESLVLVFFVDLYVYYVHATYCYENIILTVPIIDSMKKPKERS